MLKKIFPAGAINPPQGVLKIVLLAEGYRANEKKSFNDACQLFTQRFLETPPFNLTRINPASITIYSGFRASSQSGAANGASTPGRTVFESSFDTPTKTLSVNQDRINEVIDDVTTTLPYGNDSLELAETTTKGGIRLGSSSTLLILLLPPVTGEPLTISVQNDPGDDDYHFVATTTNNFWHQVVIRAIAARLGLGDEFELPGDHYLSAAGKLREMSFFNLQYLESIPATNRNPKLKWSEYFSIGEKILPPVVHPRSGDTSVPDNTINTVPVSYSSIEFWEGAGGFRTTVYRSAKDCLMRRKIGDTTLPVAQGRVPFCPVCKTYLKSLLE